MSTRKSSIAYLKIETVRYQAEYAAVTRIRLEAHEHRLPPDTPFLHQFYAHPPTNGAPVTVWSAPMRYGWEGDAIVFELDASFTGTLVLSANIATPVHPHEIASLL